MGICLQLQSHEAEPTQSTLDNQPFTPRNVVTALTGQEDVLLTKETSSFSDDSRTGK